MKLKPLFFALTTLICLTACNNNDDIDLFNSPTPAAFKAIQKNAFDNLKQKETFNAENGIVFNSAAGATLTISANCLSLNGNLVSGAVDLEYVEIFNRGDMLTTNSTTMGINANNELTQLISGGEFNIKVFQNDLELQLSCGMTLNISTALTGSNDPNMEPFVGNVDNNGNLVWLTQNTDFFLDSGNSTYNAFVQEFGWFNIDRFLSDPSPKTEIQIAVPNGFDETNASVYLALVGEPNSLAIVRGEFPVGLNAHIIFLSESEANFRYAIKTISIANGQQVSFTLNETTVASLEGLTQIINDLL